MNLKQAAQRELAIRELERRHKDKQDSLLSFITYFFKEELNKDFQIGDHHRKIEEALQKVLTGEITRLIINIPPGSGKTELITKCFPVHTMGKRDDVRFIVTGYSAQLTQNYGTEARDYYLSDTFKTVFPRRADIRDDQNTKGLWKSEKGAQYLATGVGGSITGNRANCFPSGTKILTNSGYKKIEDCLEGTSVLTYNHEKGITEYKRIRATLKRTGKGFTRITATDGSSVRGTHNHPVFVLGKGYIEIKDIKVGDRIKVFKDSEDGGARVQELQKHISERMGGVHQKSKKKQRILLHEGLFRERVQQKTQKAMQSVWEACTKGKNILFSWVQSDTKEIKEDKLSILRKGVAANILQDEVLLDGVQKQSPFKNTKRKEESKLEARNGDEELSKRVLQNERKSFRERYSLSGVWWRRKTARASQRLQSKEQHDGKSDSSLQQLSHNTSQVKEYTVQRIVTDNIEEDVYDVEVEDNHNFFAENILVHNCFIIDDPIKPDEALSDVKRMAVNRWYDNTVLSRLFNADKDAVIIVMQRTHDDDLCGYLLDKQAKGEGEQWHTIIVPAITTDEEGEETSFHPERHPLTALHKIRGNNKDDFSTQFQQEPVNKESQEFHEEFFRYYEIDDLPKRMRIFTVCDPAFKTKEQNDETAIITGGFFEDKLYILEVTHGRIKADVVARKILYHAQKWKPEKIAIEGYQAQTVLAQWVRKILIEGGIYTTIEELTQKGDKESKIRQLDGPIKGGKILWRNHMFVIEEQLKKFPRGRHDDVIDALQMLYTFYNLQPNVEKIENNFKIRYNHLGQPIFS